MIKKTEKPIMVFVSNSPIKLNATTTTMPSPLPGDPRDVVRNEVQRAIDRLEGRGEDPRTTVADKGSVNDEITAKPSMETKTKRYLLYAAPGLGYFRFAFVFLEWLLKSSLPGCLIGFSTLFPVRVLLGVCFSPSLPVVGAVAANWGCLNEQLLFTTTTFAFIQLAPVMSWPITMLLFSNEFPLYGIYAIHSTVTLALAFLFAIFHRDRPQHHPWVNGLELNRIVAGKVQELKSNRAQSGACPTLMRSLAAWSLWVGIFGIFFAIAMISTFIPSILSCQDVFMVDYLGVYSILPFTLVVCLNNVYLLMLSLAPLGLCVSGVLRSLCLVGRAYTQHITAYMGASMAVAFITAPLLVFFYMNTNSLAEWTRVFMTSAAVIIIASTIFAIFGRGRASNWAATSWDPLISSKMRNLQPIDFSQDECGLYELRLIDPNRK
uniref:Transporter n=1 Tax=Angiostrongylus cantonensis TaxID=6313 RepID=A0A158P715_ANGCA